MTGAPATVFRFGEFTFDCGSRLLMHNGVQRHLSPKAHQLLLVLLTARPRAVSREDLYDEIWPSTYVSESNLASVVNEVRRALGDDPRSPQYIRTAHGYGYAFCGEVSVVSAPAQPWTVPSSATLVCHGTHYPLIDGENLVGREVDNRVVLNDPTVSRRHAIVLVYDGAVSIRDLGSKNGTFIADHEIGRTPVTIGNGAKITLGAVVLTLVCRKVSSTTSIRVDMAAVQRLTSPG